MDLPMTKIHVANTHWKCVKIENYSIFKIMKTFYLRAIHFEYPESMHSNISSYGIPQTVDIILTPVSTDALMRTLTKCEIHCLLKPRSSEKEIY